MTKQLFSLPESTSRTAPKTSRNTGSSVLMWEEDISKEILSTRV
jgi:hypothetical protein